MSRKSKSNRATPAAAPAPQPAAGRRGLIIAIALAFVVAIVGVIALVLQGPDPSRHPALESAHSPSVGEATAKVHVVEFLDPACETCAAFYPFVKQLMAENPGRLRLTTRLIPLHKGADEVVAMLEASRAQDKYWQSLEVLLSKQELWVHDHVVKPELARQALAGVGLDWARLEADMKSPAVAERLQKDREDAAALKVTKTPEYFVNGRQMDTFGRQQLRRLVLDAISKAY